MPDADAEMAFLRQAFAARESLCHRLPQNGSGDTSELQIGDSLVMLGQAGGSIEPRPAAIYL